MHTFQPFCASSIVLCMLDHNASSGCELMQKQEEYDYATKSKIKIARIRRPHHSAAYLGRLARGRALLTDVSVIIDRQGQAQLTSTLGVHRLC